MYRKEPELARDIKDIVVIVVLITLFRHLCLNWDNLPVRRPSLGWLGTRLCLRRVRVSWVSWERRCRKRWKRLSCFRGGLCRNCLGSRCCRFAASSPLAAGGDPRDSRPRWKGKRPNLGLAALEGDSRGHGHNGNTGNRCDRLGALVRCDVDVVILDYVRDDWRGLDGQGCRDARFQLNRRCVRLKGYRGSRFERPRGKDELTWPCALRRRTLVHLRSEINNINVIFWSGKVVSEDVLSTRREKVLHAHTRRNQRLGSQWTRSSCHQSRARRRSFALQQTSLHHHTRSTDRPR
jgi:hypothetical protein